MTDMYDDLDRKALCKLVIGALLERKVSHRWGLDIIAEANKRNPSVRYIEDMAAPMLRELLRGIDNGTDPAKVFSEKILAERIPTNMTDNYDELDHDALYRLIKATFNEKGLSIKWGKACIAEAKKRNPSVQNARNMPSSMLREFLRGIDNGTDPVNVFSDKPEQKKTKTPQNPVGVTGGMAADSGLSGDAWTVAQLRAENERLKYALAQGGNRLLTGWEKVADPFTDCIPVITRVIESPISRALRNGGQQRIGLLTRL